MFNKKFKKTEKDIVLICVNYNLAANANELAARRCQIIHLVKTVSY